MTPDPAPTTTTVDDARGAAPAERRLPPVVVGILGIVVVPFLLAFAANSWTAPDVSDHLRMAFASVAGSVIAVMTAWWLAVRRDPRTGRRSGWWGALAIVVTLQAYTQAVSLVERLSAQFTGA